MKIDLFSRHGKAVLHCGDSRDVLKTIETASIDSVVTDPPYALAFMGKAWDSGETAFRPEFWREVLRVLKPGGHLLAASGTRTYHRLAVAVEDAGFEIRDMISWLYGSGFPKSRTALKPACEPWVLARKPLIGTVSANVLAYGTGALNIDGCRVEASDDPAARYNGKPARGNNVNVYGAASNHDALFVSSPAGRWPANLIHDGSDEVVGFFPDSNGGGPIHNRAAPKTSGVYGAFAGEDDRWAGYGDSGSAARFFYSAKASKVDRAGSKHPTVKPLELMRYLCRLITPPGGVVLDPFAGTGTTGEAAIAEGFAAVLIEREPEYQEDIRRRLSGVLQEVVTCDAGAKRVSSFSVDGPAD